MQITINIINFCCLLLAVYATGENIVVPPSDTTGLVGLSAQFSCNVTFGPIQDLTWEHNGKYIYSYLNGEEEYPQGRSKYEVRRSGSTFYLEIKMLNLADSGIITCNCFTDSANAVLIVIANPVLRIDPETPEEGDSTTITCEASFGGPNKELISPDHFPKLELHLEGITLPAAENDDDKTSYDLHKVYNMNVSADMDEGRITCMIQTTRPAFNAAKFDKLKVLYSARNITYTPQLTQYEVGSHLTCTAQGNPSPIIEWDNTAGKTFQNKQLQITESMVGPNKWICTALNIIRGIKHEESTIAEFAVVKYYNSATDPVDDVSENKINSSKYWIIGLILTIVGIGVFLLVKKWKQQRSETTTDSARETEEPTRQQALVTLSTSGDGSTNIDICSCRKQCTVKNKDS